MVIALISAAVAVTIHTHMVDSVLVHVTSLSIQRVHMYNVVSLQTLPLHTCTRLYPPQFKTTNNVIEIIGDINSLDLKIMSKRQINHQ